MTIDLFSSIADFWLVKSIFWSNLADLKFDQSGSPLRKKVKMVSFVFQSLWLMPADAYFCKFQLNFIVRDIFLEFNETFCFVDAKSYNKTW